MGDSVVKLMLEAPSKEKGDTKGGCGAADTRTPAVTVQPTVVTTPAYRVDPYYYGYYGYPYRYGYHYYPYTYSHGYSRPWHYGYRGYGHGTHGWGHGHGGTHGGGHSGGGHSGGGHR